MVLGEVGDDADDEGLERLVPSILVGIEDSVAVDYPPQVARTRRTQDEGRRGRRMLEQTPDHPHGPDQPSPILAGERRQQGGDVLG